MGGVFRSVVIAICTWRSMYTIRLQDTVLSFNRHYVAGTTTYLPHPLMKKKKTPELNWYNVSVFYK